MLHRLADSSGGLYCYIEEGEMIAAAFAECLGGLQALVAQNVRLEISVPPVLGATIRSVVTTYRSQLYDEEAHGGAEGNAKAVIFFGDLQSGESRDVVIDIDLPPADTSSGPVAQDVLLLSVEYFDVGRSATCSELPTAVSVSRTHDDGAVTTGTASEVDTQRCRVLVAHQMAVARERAAAGDLAGAREALQSAQRAVAAPQVAGTEVIHQHTTPAYHPTGSSNSRRSEPAQLTMWCMACRSSDESSVETWSSVSRGFSPVSLGHLRMASTHSRCW
jgi:hypothetical protein